MYMQLYIERQRIVSSKWYARAQNGDLETGDDEPCGCEIYGLFVHAYSRL